MELRSEFITIEDFTAYKRVRIRLHQQGVELRDKVQGVELRTKRQQLCRAGDVIVAEIDAKVGGYGVIPDELDGAIVSSHYFLFEVNQDVMDPAFLKWALRNPGFQDQIVARGSTNYAAVRPQQIAEWTIPLPDLEWQRRIVAELVPMLRIAEAVVGRMSWRTAALKGLLGSWLRATFGGACDRRSRLGDVSVVLRGRGPKYTVDSGCYAVNQACVRWDGLDLAQAREVEREWWYQQPDELRLVGGDVLVNSTGEGTIGRASVVRAYGVGLPVDSHVLIARPDEATLVPEYLALYLRSPQGQLAIEDAKGATTTKQTELGKMKLESLVVPTPGLEDQRAVVAAAAEVVTSVRRASSLSDGCLAKARALEPSSLLQLLG